MFPVEDQCLQNREECGALVLIPGTTTSRAWSCPYLSFSEMASMIGRVYLGN